jgi:hypothetical protein
MNTLVKIGVALFVLVGVFALTWFVYYPYSPLGKQNANLRLAEKYQPQVEANLRKTKGTDRVKVSINTGLGGSLQISGDAADLQTIKAVIDAVLECSPPVTVQFLLTVGESNFFSKVVAPGDAVNEKLPFVH